MGGEREFVRSLAGPSSLAAMLPDFLRAQRWFGGKAQPIRAVSVTDVMPVSAAEITAAILLVRVEYREGPAETYSVPMIQARDVASVPRFATGESAPHLMITREGATFVLYDAMGHPAFLDALLEAVRDDRCFRGERGELRAARTPGLEKLAPAGQELAARLMRAEQSNTSVIYGERLVLKMFRKLAEGTNPDIEIGRFLTEKTGYRNIPLLAGSIEYVDDNGVRSSLAMLQAFVNNRGDAWDFTLGAVGRCLARVRAAAPPELPPRTLLELASGPLPRSATEVAGEYIEASKMLGRRTAELHLALSTHAGDAAFDPEPDSVADQRDFYERALALLDRNFRLLERQIDSLPRHAQLQAREILGHAPELQRRFREFEDHPVSALRTRIHGDYHLGQVLVVERDNGHDFVIIDFEGEPARSLGERRKKRSPLQDVAGMLRSFHYAAFAPLLGVGPGALQSDALAKWAYAWQTWVSAAFLREYLAVAGSAAFLPRDRFQMESLLNAHLLEKAVYELGYELNNRPSWVRVPLSGIEQLIRPRVEERETRRRIA